ncbi:SMC domain protein [Methanofollis liminatans DSM 4140]|uniref:SMC domain protein n=1 Tax=Methanofollis liminatans DSM 4140 TaxID=28892 RepID=J0S0A4_9EURY|nr:AAA family ATPase [Methanofollis liminatans]EJG07276.1 SMC domain protein [Methanofollis liminatans DSM 4140]
MLRLKRLKVKNCRGIIDGPDVVFGTGGAVICGDNGTGKSSYIDALEKVLTGKCSSLDIGAQELSWKKQGTHIRSDSNPEIQMILTDGNKDETVSLGKSTESFPKDVQKFLKASQESKFILRRRILLDFIEAKPAQRYKAIEGFLNVDRYVAFEQKLIDHKKDLEKGVKELDDKISQNKQEIRKILKIDPKIPITKECLIEQFNICLKDAGIREVTDFEEFEVCVGIIDADLRSFQNISQWQGIIDFSKELANAPSYSEVIRSEEEYYSASKEFKIESGTLKGQLYEKVLQDGLRWIKEDALEQCPLCNSPINADEIQKFVQQKINEHKSIIASKNICNAKYNLFFQAISNYAKFLEKTRRTWDELLKVPLIDRYDTFQKVIEEIVASNSKISEPEKIEQELARLLEFDGNAIIHSMKEVIDERCASSPDIDRYKKLIDLKNSIAAVLLHHSTIQGSINTKNNTKVVSEQITQISEYATKARKEAIKILMSEIGKVTNEYYQYIHPGESIGSPAFELPDGGSGSIKIISEFYGTEDDPRGHYSEGHVDSLGLCIFLAIRRFQYNQNPNLSLLVLDDVLQSVDAGHRRKTAEMIFEKFNDHQIVITTHDLLWFEYLKQASKRHMRSKKLKYYKISDWNIDTGPIFGDHLNDYEWLISKNAGKSNPQDKAIKAGRVLEEILQNLCNNLNVSVRFSLSSKYTIDPLWNAFYSKSKEFNSFYSSNKKCLDTIEKTRTMRNWAGAHWNSWATNLTESEAREFCDAVIGFRKGVFCEHCNEFIRRISEIDNLWSCKCEKIRYKKGE